MKTLPLHRHHALRQADAWKRRLLFCAFASFLIWGCQGGEKPEHATVKRPVITGIKTMTVSPVLVDDFYETSGTVKADHVVTIAARIMGTVTALHVREGDRVKAGQVLLNIENRDLAQKVKAADMAVETANLNRSLAEATWRRYRNLFEEKALSQQEMDQVETQKKVAQSRYEQAQAGADEAKTYREYATIRAPFAGTVTSRPIAGGGMAVPGQPLLTIESEHSLYVEGFVDEALMGRLRKGMPAELAFDTAKEPHRGAIRDLIPAVDPRSRTFLIKVGPPPAGLKSGLFARIRIPLGKKERLLVPTAAVDVKGQLTGVYTVGTGGLVTLRLVKAGRTTADGRTEISAGLSPGERIIVEGIRNAVDGGIIQENTPK